MKNNTGILYGIGVGPGDPELLTLKAQRLINDSDVVAYPAPETGDGIALEIVRPLLLSDPKLLPLMEISIPPPVGAVVGVTSLTPETTSMTGGE